MDMAQTDSVPMYALRRRPYARKKGVFSGPVVTTSAESRPMNAPRTGATRAPTIRTARPSGSGMSCHHTRRVSLDRGRWRARRVARLHDEHRVSRDREGLRGSGGAGALDHHLLRADLCDHIVRG